MNIINCTDFINEARVSKDDVVAALLDMFKSKPLVKMEKHPDEKGMYSIGGMKKYLSDYKPMTVSNALFAIKDDKKVKLESIYVSHEWSKDRVPYWYIGLSKEEATKLKENYEKQGKEKNPASTKVVESPKSVAKKATKEEGVEKRPGSPAKKRVTKKAATKTARKK